MKKIFFSILVLISSLASGQQMLKGMIMDQSFPEGNQGV